MDSSKDCGGAGFIPCPGCPDCHAEVTEFRGGPQDGNWHAISIATIELHYPEEFPTGYYRRSGSGTPMVWTGGDTE